MRWSGDAARRLHHPITLKVVGLDVHNDATQVVIAEEGRAGADEDSAGEGVRQKTNRRDAAQLARSLRAGELEGIHVPDEGDETFREPPAIARPPAAT